MSAPTVVRDLVVAHTRMLKLPGVARTFESLARQARDSHWSHEDYLHEVLRAEEASRHESVIRQRLREARFPEVKTLDTFDFAAADGINATQIHTLARGEWITAPENLILAGPIGTGKTHLAIALGVEATKQKRRVLFTRARADDPPQPIIYRAGYKADDPEDNLVVASPRPFESSRGRRRVVVFVNTSARIVTEAEFQELMLRQRRPERDIEGKQ